MKRSEMKLIINKCYNGFIDDWVLCNLNNLDKFVGLSERILLAVEEHDLIKWDVEVDIGRELEEALKDVRAAARSSRYSSKWAAWAAGSSSANSAADSAAWAAVDYKEERAKQVEMIKEVL